MGVFVLSSSLNFLDRGLLAALASAIEREFHIDDQGYGFLVGAFSLAYALSAPATGYLLDRFGLNRAATLFVGWWSAVSMLTGATWSYGQLVACRIGLGVGESGGIPAVAKMGAIYLPTEERALGSALGQVGITVGSVLATTAGVVMAVRYGWRFPFFVTGVLGLLWIPIWLLMARGSQPAAQAEARSAVPLDRRLIVLVIANIMWMGIYSLWTNWTSLYLQRAHHLSLAQTAHYAWIPALASNLGGFFGGWLALRWIGQGTAPVSARVRVILLSALGGLFTLLVPFAPGPAWGIAAISLSFFWTLAGSVNVYTIPIDLYGAEQAGRAISALVFAYGILQTFISPLIGRVVMSSGYGPVCWMVALPPLFAWLLLRLQFATTHYLDITEEQELVDAIETIRRFVEDRSTDPWEWDDFISVPARNKDVREIQGLCLELPTTHPPTRRIDYCNEAGLAKLQVALILLESKVGKASTGLQQG